MKTKLSYKIIILYILCVALQSCGFKKDKTEQHKVKNDSISLWIKLSKKTSFPLEKRKLFLKKSYSAIKHSRKDTVACRNLSRIAYRYLKLKDTSNYKLINKEAYKLALILKDTFTLADTHWSESDFYTDREVYDSAYYHYDKAYKYFEALNKQYYAAKMLYMMSFIKGRFRDYSGSEILTIKAISKYKLLNKHKSLYSSYNHLAILQKELGEYEKSLFYYEKALEFLDKSENKKDFYNSILNNIGGVYLSKGEYLKAIGYFNKILKDDSLKMTNPARYARVIDNKAYCKLLNNDTVNIRQDFYESLRIRDSLNNKAGIELVKIHLSEYYAVAGDSLKAILYAKEANILAKKIKNGQDYLASLKLLSNLDKKNAKFYLERYIKYNDSLQDIDRKIQNKFTRISYETDEYIDRTKILSQQNIWIFMTGLVLLITSVSLYFIKAQRSRNEKLLLENEQQKANEQVYILTLEQQSKLEEEKTKERNRISEELHDGVLGKLFGTRIGLGFLNLKGNDDTLKQHQSFLDELQDIEKEIRDVSHKLNDNFSNSEINFGTIINQLLKEKSKTGNFTYQLAISEEIIWKKVNEITKANLYRVLQEALQNIIKYAKAKNVILNFSIEKENLVVSINDDGVGFNIKRSKKGIGLKNMKSRMQKLDGSFSVHSEIGKGTSVKFVIPT